LLEPLPRGLPPPFDVCMPWAPFCEGNDQEPRSGPLISSVASTLRLARPHGQPSDTAPRCLEPVSTTDVSRHEHPWQTPSLETPAERRGKPANVRLRDRLSERERLWRRWSSDDAGPPCGHPASNSLALDGATPASGRSAAPSCLRARWGESTAALSAGGGFAESSPLAPLVDGWT
jgi:hypothetical protein